MKGTRRGNHTRIIIEIETLVILFSHLEKIIRRWRKLLLENMEIVKKNGVAACERDEGVEVGDKLIFFFLV